MAEALHCPVVLSQSWILIRFAPKDEACLITELRQYLVSVVKLIPAPTIPARTFPQRKDFVQWNCDLEMGPVKCIEFIGVFTAMSERIGSESSIATTR